MKRQEKYPDTLTFHYHNANPKNKFTGDCVIRALCTAMKKSYEQVLKELCENSLKTGYSISSTENYDRYLKSQGWIKQKQPRKVDNTKYTGEEFCYTLQEGTTFKCNENECDMTNDIIANIGGHHVVAIINGRVWDSWDSTDGCIGNYWIKI